MATQARRALFSRPWRGAADASAANDLKVAAGQALRKHLTERYFGGELHATDLVIQAHYHTLSGGVGLEDLAVKPHLATKHASDHVSHVLGRTLARPDTMAVVVPAYEKRACRRDEFTVPNATPNRAGSLGL